MRITYLWPAILFVFYIYNTIIFQLRDRIIDSGGKITLPGGRCKASVHGACHRNTYPTYYMHPHEISLTSSDFFALSLFVFINLPTLAFVTR